MNRQEFLKSLAIAGMTAAVSTHGSMDVLAQGAKRGKKQEGPADLAAVIGGEPAEMFNAAIQRMGGMGRFVKKGQKVCIKPNIGWIKTPELAGNTNPELIVAVIKACQQAGASEVTVFDHTCDEWRGCYTTSGIQEAAENAGAKVLPGNDERYYTEVQLPLAKNLKTCKLHNAILECDCWINIPILKTHSGARMTIAMKNLMGIVWDRRFFHTNNLNQCIADICTYEKMPVLNIVDAYRVMKSNGPRGRSLADVVNPKGLFISPDIVAVDTAATRFFNQIVEMPLDEVGYLAIGDEMNIGTMNLNSLNTARVRM
ncbi:MAG: DUF362 domain-containing protein [Planctomycetia bacterium]|nr:DUF362 domain-containing protein [Planctomycetia bacterium]